MAAGKIAANKSQAGDVEEFRRTFEHPLKAGIEAVRALILAADATIQEGIKWNAPSFYVREYFATIHVKNTLAVQVIFHLGAKRKRATGVVIDDPNGLLEWPAQDRASVKFGDLNAIQSNQAAFQHIVRQWIAHSV